MLGAASTSTDHPQRRLANEGVRADMALERMDSLIARNHTRIVSASRDLDPGLENRG